MISGGLVPGFLALLYLLAVFGAIIYVLICLARITGALQGIAASLRRIEQREEPPAPDGLSRAVDV
jgi:hypothetical protein